MTLESGRNRAGEPGFWTRLRPVRTVLILSLAGLAGLAAGGRLEPLPALFAAALLMAAALWGAHRAAVPPPASSLPSRAADAPPAAEEVLGRILDGLPDPVIALAGDATVVALNAPARAMSPALRRGEPAALALRDPNVVEAVRRATTTGEPQRAEFSERVPIDRWYAVQLMPVPAGTVSQRPLFLLTFHDLTPLRRVEEMRADFVANASHELRTPLAALSGFIDTLRGPARDDPAARERFLAIMKDQARRMARLIDDLLSLSRIELNAHIPPETVLDLAPLVRQVADGLQMLARERGVAIAFEAAEPLLVRGDRDELIRVFENLLENALKYGGSGGRVEILTARGPLADGTPEARVSVRDFGSGIAPEHLPRLTERFYRVDVRQSRTEGGTGLGLALVKHILNRHRGRLVIDSTLGEGATFTVCLPLASIPSEN